MSGDEIDGARRQEAHFGDRVVYCYSDRASNVSALLECARRVHGGGEALVCGDERLTYDQLSDCVAVFAGGVARLGTRRGDRVALLLANSAEFVIAFLAVVRLGAIVVPVNVRQSAAEIASVIADCRASVVIAHSEFVDKAPAAPERVLVEIDAAIPFAGRIAAVAGSETDTIECGEDDVAALIYTSGTTGRPKGVMVTHLGLVHAGMTYAAVLQLTASDRSVCAAPLSHVTGLTGGLMASIAAGAAVIVTPSFKADRFLSLAAQERMSVTIMVPAMYKLCLLSSEFDARKLNRWRIAGYGGAMMPPALIEELSCALPGLRLVNCYGATETTSPVAMMPASETAERPWSVGRAVPCAEILIMDEHGRSVLAGEEGEIYIRAPTVARGYWENSEATSREFVGGFWRSGDVGRLVDGVYLELLDRKKDVINRGGYKIYCAEVENVLAALDAVEEVAVVGRACPVLGERVHAIIVSRASVKEHTLRAACAAVLSDYKVPETFHVRATPLPRNANGKVMKQVLRADPDAV